MHVILKMDPRNNNNYYYYCCLHRDKYNKLGKIVTILDAISRARTGK